MRKVKAILIVIACIIPTITVGFVLGEYVYPNLYIQSYPKTAIRREGNHLFLKPKEAHRGLFYY